ncbi:hypothetical protein B566_EDAN008829 [Ephemera danica]|nr:hypothetical protein B566_EDAN008829 [Ephemera danica]
MKLRVLLLASALLCFDFIAEIMATENVKELNNENEILKPNTDTENRGGYWNGPSSNGGNKRKPRPPPLMDTSFECCKDIQDETVNLQRDLFTFNVKLNDTFRQVVKERVYLTDLQTLTTRNRENVKYLVNGTSILDAIENKLFNLNLPIYSGFTFDLISLIAKIRH